MGAQGASNTPRKVVEGLRRRVLHTGPRRIKKFLRRVERLEILNFWVVETLNFLARLGPSVPKLESLVVTTAFAEVNFVEEVSGLARSGARCAPFCPEL